MPKSSSEKKAMNSSALEVVTAAPKIVTALRTSENRVGFSMRTPSIQCRYTRVMTAVDPGARVERTRASCPAGARHNRGPRPGEPLYASTA